MELSPPFPNGHEQATGLEGLGASDDLLDLGVDSLMSVGISAVRIRSPR